MIWYILFFGIINKVWVLTFKMLKILLNMWVEHLCPLMDIIDLEIMHNHHRTSYRWYTKTRTLNFLTHFTVKILRTISQLHLTSNVIMKSKGVQGSLLSRIIICLSNFLLTTFSERKPKTLFNVNIPAVRCKGKEKEIHSDIFVSNYVWKTILHNVCILIYLVLILHCNFHIRTHGVDNIEIIHQISSFVSNIIFHIWWCWMHIIPIITYRIP